MKIKETKKETIIFSKETSYTWYTNACYNTKLLRNILVHLKLTFDEKGYLTLRDVYEQLGMESKNVSWFAGWDSRFDKAEDITFTITENPETQVYILTTNVHYFEED